MYQKNNGREDRRRAQLSALRAEDPDIEEIPVSASHVALYELRADAQGVPAWRKTEIEGSLYLLKRNNKPRLKILIKNQADSSEGDFSQEIDRKVECEVRDQTLYYKVGDDGLVRGLWFHSSETLNQFVSVIQDASSKIVEGGTDAGKHLLQLLGKSKTSPKTEDASSILRDHVMKDARIQEETSASALLGALMQQNSVGRSPPAEPILRRPAQPIIDSITLRKSDLRLVLADMVSSDDFVNELFARLAARSSF